MSARRLLEDFLLPLVRGGTVSVFRPIDRPAMERLLGATFVAAVVGDLSVPSSAADALAVIPSPRMPRVARESELTLQLGRHAYLQTLPVNVEAPLLDVDTWRLAIVLHNLIALSATPEVVHEEGSRPMRRRASLIALTAKMASLHAPDTLASALERHSLHQGLLKLRRTEHQVTFWAGQRSYVGRPVPAHMRPFARLRRIRVATTTREWPALEPAPGTRPILDALETASPVASALALGTGGYTVSWPHMLSVMRFAPLGRLLAARILDRGLSSVGESLAIALVEYAQQPISRSEELRAATQFLAHCLWLSELSPGPQHLPGPVLSALLHTAFSHAPALVTPPDLNRNRGNALVAGTLRGMTDLLARLETVGQVYEVRHPGVMLQLLQRVSPRNPEPIHVR